MKTRLFILAALVVLVLSGCSVPSASRDDSSAVEAPAAEEQLPTEEPSPVPPTATNTPEPTATATATATETPEPIPPRIKSNMDESVCYFGPGTEYSIEGAITGEEFVPVLGRDQLSEWVQIAHPTRERVFCWLPLEKVFLEGDLDMAPNVPAPAPFVAYVSVDMSPDSRSLSCGSYTFDVKFSISVTGPTTVKFRRNPSGDSAGSLESYTFSEAGIQTFTDSMTRGETGTHTFRVEVSSPNEISGEDSSILKCE